MLCEQYIQAVESSNIISRTDIRGVITFVNDEFCRISGYSRDELIGRNHNIVRHPDVPAETFEKLWDAILSGQTYSSTVKNMAKDGSTFYVNTTITPILAQDGSIEEFIAIRYDVTKEMELQMQLQQKQEMLLWQSRFASLGQMMANIAHQWRQPLTELNLSIYNLKKAGLNRDNTRIEELYHGSRHIIESMSQTIDDFQNFFKPDKAKETFDPQVSLSTAMAMLTSVLDKEHIAVHKQISQDISIIGIQNELTQVLVNILQNAKDALVANRSSQRSIHIAMDRIDTNIKITICDNAGGVPVKIMGEIFEPYFTTKHTSQGTGLGLFMSKLIVEKSLYGTLKVINQKQGACFEIMLPAAQRSQDVV